MANAGGSANINGILYQILGTLGHAAQCRLTAANAGGTEPDVTLVIEPKGGGGDLRIDTGTRLVVEQWKSRSGARTWSLAEVISGVLPDLYRATGHGADEYRFRTDGRVDS